MDAYLQQVNSWLTRLDDLRVHVVLGNESCDLDSAVCTLVYAYYLSTVHAAAGVAVIPVMNMRRRDFALHTEVTHALRGEDLLDHLLTFREDIDLRALNDDGRLVLTLVDRNVLDIADRPLDGAVVEVIDHRARERVENETESVTIELVGSCCTLVAEKLINQATPVDPKCLRLLYGTILLDTVCLSAARKNTTPKDVDIIARLEQLLPNCDRQTTFNDLQKALTNTSGLSTVDLLRKDLKIVNSETLKVAISSIPGGIETLLRRDDISESLMDFSERQAADVVVMMSLSVSDEEEESGTTRQLAVYSRDERLREDLVAFLSEAGPPVSLGDHIPSLRSPNTVAFHQTDAGSSRKKVLPVVQTFLQERLATDRRPAPVRQSSVDDVISSLNTLRMGSERDCPSTPPNSRLGAQAPVPSTHLLELVCDRLSDDSVADGGGRCRDQSLGGSSSGDAERTVDGAASDGLIGNIVAMRIAEDTERNGREDVAAPDDVDREDGGSSSQMTNVNAVNGNVVARNIARDMEDELKEALSPQKTSDESAITGNLVAQNIARDMEDELKEAVSSQKTSDESALTGNLVAQNIARDMEDELKEAVSSQKTSDESALTGNLVAQNIARDMEDELKEALSPQKTSDESALTGNLVAQNIACDMEDELKEAVSPQKTSDESALTGNVVAEGIARDMAKLNADSAKPSSETTITEVSSDTAPTVNFVATAIAEEMSAEDDARDDESTAKEDMILALSSHVVDDAVATAVDLFAAAAASGDSYEQTSSLAARMMEREEALGTEAGDAEDDALHQSKNRDTAVSWNADRNPESVKMVVPETAQTTQTAAAATAAALRPTDLTSTPKKKIMPTSADRQAVEDDMFDGSDLSSNGSDIAFGRSVLSATTPDELMTADIMDDSVFSGSLDWESDTPETPIEPIPEYSAAQELKDSRSWKLVEICGKQYRIDMKVVEPYKRVISHGGYYGDGFNAIVVLTACHLPDKRRRDYHYVMDHLFLYVLSTLELLVVEDYMMVYFHGAAPQHKIPSLRWLKRCYDMIDRRLRKNLKSLLIVHPTFWLKTVVLMTKPFLSSKFSSKLQYVHSLSELCQRVPSEYIYIPDEIKQYDASVNKSTTSSPT